MTTVIQATGLAKTFGKLHALDGLDLSVDQGEVHGFLGPNGAGKSTAIRVLLGLIRASGGAVSVFGQDPWRESVALHRRIAYVPGDVSLWPNLSGGEVIDLLTRLRGGAVPNRRAELIEVFQFDPSKKSRSYSKGNRQKVALIAALAVPAELYIFDEPTSGLDPLMESIFRQQVQAAVGQGATVLLSSHILSEVEHLCHRVSIIRAGRNVESGTLVDLRHLTRTEFSFATDRPTEHLLISGLVHDTAIDGSQVKLTVDSVDIPAVLGLLATMDVQALTVAPPSLEELFMRHYDGRNDERGRTVEPVER